MLLWSLQVLLPIALSKSATFPTSQSIRSSPKKIKHMPPSPFSPPAGIGQLCHDWGFVWQWVCLTTALSPPLPKLSLMYGRHVEHHSLSKDTRHAFLSIILINHKYKMFCCKSYRREILLYYKLVAHSGKLLAKSMTVWEHRLRDVVWRGASQPAYIILSHNGRDEEVKTWLKF